MEQSKRPSPHNDHKELASDDKGYGRLISPPAKKTKQRQRCKDDAEHAPSEQSDEVYREDYEAIILALSVELAVQG